MRLSLLLLLTACDAAATSEGETFLDPDCAESANFLDVSQGPGPGDGYADPWLTVQCDDDVLTVESNGMPHYTFVALTPNALVEVDQHFEVTRSPAVAASTTELPLLGTIGFTVTGLPMFGANEGAVPAEEAYGDPIYNGLMDGCMGHTANEYHHHAVEQKCLVASGLVAEPWLLDDPDATSASPVLGYGADGFPLYGPYGCLDADCTEIVEYTSGWVEVGDPTSNAWDAYEWQDSGDATVLDECNGHTGPLGDYHYHATSGFPYILGCYRGTPSADSGAEANTDDGGGGDGGGEPPDCADVEAGMPCCGDDTCDGPETVDNCAEDCA
jgi:hypothetical protein